MSRNRGRILSDFGDIVVDNRGALWLIHEAIVADNMRALWLLRIDTKENFRSTAAEG